MVKTIGITDLMKATGINHEGRIQVTDEMSGLETNPREDWLYYGLNAFKAVAKEKGNEILTAAIIGSGNGIDAIAAVKTFRELQDIYVTDILPNILPQIEKSIRENVQTELRGKNIKFLTGRDCLPLEQKVDLIYGNLPLIAVDAEETGQQLATTTLTDAAAYMHFSRGKDDRLRQYSLLSQLGFLITAKERLNENGAIITLIGGRVPYEVIEECFARANLEHKLLFTGFKKQSDPQFLQQYADYEARERVQFIFYDYSKADKILQAKGITAPDIIKGYTDAQLKVFLKPAQINADQAYGLYKQGKDVGHLAFAFEAYKPKADKNRK